MSNNNLKFYVDQLDALEDEKLGVIVQITDIYNAAKEAGHCPKALRNTLKLYRMDKAKREKLEEINDRTAQYCLDMGI